MIDPYCRNVSSTNIFILPTLNIPRNELIKVGLVDAFIEDELRDLQFERAIYLLFKPKEGFNLFVEEQRESNMPIIDEYDYDEFTILVYKLQKKFEKDYDLIRLGKFSETSKEFQNFFPKWYKLGENGQFVDKMMFQHMIFSKDQELKDYWKKELDIDIPNDVEHWAHYSEKEVLNSESLNRIRKI